MRAREIVGWTPGVYVLPFTLECFREKYLAVTLDVEIASSAEIVERLLAGKVQPALIGGPADDECAETHTFAELCVVPPARLGGAGAPRLSS
jgi:DNA-binding transcriptional LysR family regulator